MNAKQLKKIRKAVRATDVPLENNYEATRVRKLDKATGFPVERITLVLAGCQRALYKELKKNFKRKA